MKKMMMMCLLVGFCWSGQAQEALITGYVDSPCPSADGRTIEIYVNGTIDFTGWNLVRQSNGGGYTTNIDISTLGTLTDEFAYITNDAATLDTEFGIGATTNSIVENGSINDNGNDAFQIIDDVATVIDRFGEDEVDGAGTGWEHTDSYYYRNDGSAANAGTFDSTNWTFGTLGLLDEEGTCNSGAALSTLVPFGSFVPASETCSLIATSFTEGFNTEIPGCWTVVNNDGGDYTWEHDTEYPHSGAGHLTLHWESDAHDDYLISPQFTVTSGVTDQLSFYAGGTGTTFPETFDVKLSITGTLPADFTELLGSETTSADVEGGGDYINYTYDISAYDGENVYVAIVGTSTNEFYLYVDEFSINTPPSCPFPIGLTVENITTDSADITWTAGGTEIEWQVLYGPTGFDPQAEGTSVADDDGTLGITIPGLTPVTEYDVYVKAVCDVGDESEWVGPETFTALALPPDNDECSSAISITVNTDATCTLITTGTTAGGTASSQTDDVTGTPGNDVWFTFVATATTHIISLSNVTAEIGSSTDMGMGLYDGSAGCSALIFVADSDPNSFEASSLTVGTTYYLRVYGWSDSTSAQASFDICVTTVPDIPENDACSDAIEVLVFPYTNSQNAASATNNDGFIAVDDCGEANDGVWYAITGDGGEITVEVTETSNWDSELEIFTGTCGSFTCVDNIDTGNDTETLTFLSDVGTIYYVNIAHYSGSTDNPEGSFDLAVTTTGLITCPDPTELTVENITSDSADVIWTAGGSETEWEVLYGLTGFDPSTEGTSITDDDGTLGVNIPGLTGETEYDVYVKAICGVGDESDWAGLITFSTLCDAVMAPYVEGFADDDTPVCWIEGGDTAWDYSTGSDAAVGDHTYGGGTNYAWIDGSDNGDTEVSTLTSPLVDISSLTTPALEFFLFSYNTVDTAVNNIMVEFYDGDNWTIILNLPAGLGPNWQYFKYDLSGFNVTGDVQVRFTVTGNANGGDTANNDILIDDVSFDEMPTCSQPTNLSVSDIMTTSADLSWTENGTATIWDIEVVTAGASPTGIPTDAGVTTTTYTETDLTGDTSYEFYVRADCGGGDLSDWAGPLAFSTPYCQIEFGSAVEPITLVEIASLSNSTDPTPDGTPSVEDFTGTTIEVEQGGAYEISLEGNTVGNYENFFTVFVDWNQNGILNDTGEIYEIGSIINSDGTDDQQATGTIAVPMDAMLGTTRFRVYKNFNASAIDPCEENDFGQIEDYTINISLPCADPSSLSEVEMTAESITVTWTENGTATSWEIIYGVPGFDPMTEGTVELDNDGSLEYTISGLDPDTTYDVYIRAICANGESEWAGPGTFTTLPAPCPPPTDITVGEIADTSAEILWTENGTAVEWEIEYGETGFAQGTGTIITDNDGTLGEIISSLLSDTSYDVYVRSICAGNESDWTGPENFMTDLGILDDAFQGFTYYPNPVNNELVLKATENIQNVVVYDMLGREVITLQPENMQPTLNMSNLQLGTYLMKVSINGAKQTFRIIKK